MRRFFLGYNTNGLANHTFPDACRLLQKHGYEGIAITIDHDLLMRTDDDRLEFRTPPAEIARIAKSHNLRCVVETGARYLLDPFRKHEPTFFDDKYALRQAYYFRAIELAAETEATCVSIWSGVGTLEAVTQEDFAAYLESAKIEISDARMVESALIETQRLHFCRRLLPVMDYARELGVKIALEPEPGMFVRTAEDYDTLRKTLETLDTRAAAELWLTLDTGHLVCNDEDIVDTFIEYKDRLVNIHLDDAIPYLHKHMELGDGELNFKKLKEALEQSQFSGGVCVELSRHSHCAVETVKKTWKIIRRVWDI